MLIKKFKAANMQEALKMVKAEFGLDAMILNSREERPKGIKGIFRKPYFEVTAAMAPPHQGREESERPVEESRRNTRDEFRNSMLEPLAREIKMLKDKVETLFEREANAERPELSFMGDFREEPGYPQGGAAEDIPKPAPFENLLMRAGGNQAAVANRVDEMPSAPREKRSVAENRSELLDFAEKLRMNGIETEVADTLLERIVPFIGRKRKAEALRKGLGQALESLADFDGEEARDGRRIIALVGPAGVGKTTTIAKIAAAAAEQGKRVAVVTADSLKADAAKKLKPYAGKTEIVVNTAATPQKIAKAMDNYREKDIVLVDTAGISPDDQGGMEELQELLAACPGIEKHLCLSSTTRDRELDDTVRRFERYAIDRLIFTRLDESRTFGSIINVLLRSNLPLSYLTSGQKITGEIEIATAARLSELATGGSPS
jgi:flagellar biosynthesis protein FlhF